MTAISIALCTYNGERFLAEQLASIADQTLQPSELVVFDDASTDTTLRIVKSFAATAPFPLRIERHDATVGPTQNFASAIATCAGDYIALADQDDIWLVDKLERLHRCAQASGASLVFGDAELVREDLSSLGRRMFDHTGFTSREQRMMRAGRQIDVLLRHNVVTGATALFRRRFVPSILPIPDGWVHDAWIAFVLAMEGRLDFVGDPVILYRQHGGNVTGAGRTPWEKVRADRSSYLEQTRGTLAGWATLRERAVERGDEALALSVSHKVAHTVARVGLPAGRMRRLPPVARELASGRYGRYARGWRSAARDLLI